MAGGHSDSFWQRGYPQRIENQPAGMKPKRPHGSASSRQASPRLPVVIRRGPAKQACTILWNRRTDEFTLGEANALAAAFRTVDAEDGA